MRASLKLIAITALVSALSAQALAATNACRAVLKLDELTRRVTPEAMDKRAAEVMPHIQEMVFTTRAGRKLFLQLAPPKDGYPIILALPGSNRSNFITQADNVALALEGFGLALPQYHTQPWSISRSSPEDRKAQKDKETSTQDLARDIEDVADYLVARGGHEVIPYALSFSGAVSPHLKNFPLIIDVAPLTSMIAAHPELVVTNGFFDGMSLFNPFFSSSAKRYVLDSSYRKMWSSVSKRMINENPGELDPSLYNDYVDGYTKMSRALEGHDWAKLTPEKETKRVFILSENDDRPFLLDELRAVQRLNQQGYKTLTIFVKGAGHHFYGQHPKVFAALFELVVNGPLKSETGFAVADLEKAELAHVKGKEAVGDLEQTLKTLSETK